MEHRPEAEVEWADAPAEWFTGKVQFGGQYVLADEADLNVIGVAFEPGARTDWHTHPGGQVLYIVDGTALVQNEGGERIEAAAGDTVRTPAGDLHWHGATPDGPMMHLSITHAGATQWIGKKVTDAEYGGGE